MGSSGRTFLMSGISPGIWGSSIIHRNQREFGPVCRVRTDECDVNATRSKGATLSCPPEPVLENPRVKVILGSLGKAEIGRSNTLENIVVVLGRAEHARGRVRDIPVRVVRVKKKYAVEVSLLTRRRQHLKR